MSQNKVYYKPFNKFILRTPYLSLDKIQNISIEKIKQLCEDKTVSEAIFIASPELHREMLKSLSSQNSVIDKSLQITLLKYIIRMGSRCTPFGIFSGCSIGDISSEKTKIELSESAKHQKVTRIDMNYLCSIVQEIESNKDLRNHLLYFPNNSIYNIGNELRYVEYKHVNFRRDHYTISIDDSEYLRRIFKFSANGKNIEELSNLIVEDDISLEDATNFIHELIDNQILTSSLMPNVSGIDYFEKIRNTLKDINIDYNSFFNEVNEYITKLDKNDIDIEDYIQLNKILLKNNDKSSEKFLIQKDLYISCDNININEKISESIYQGLRVLNKLTKFNENKNLTDFKNAFFERYETEEVALSLAIDAETGIGYGNIKNNNNMISPLIDDLNINYNRVNDSSNQTFNLVDEIIYNKYKEVISKEKNFVEIFDNDLKDLVENWNDLPATFSVMTNIYNNSNDDELKIHLEFSGGSTAARLIGRFSYLDNKVHNHIQEIYEKEDEINGLDVVNAEIVHLPESRTGNITHRYSTRTYEIPYLAKSELGATNKLDITDLYVSIKNDKILLRSKKMNKIIKPFLSNAHNYSYNALPLYNFLCDLQGQGTRRSLLFKWPGFLIDSDFLPRVVYKNFILSLAEWNIKWSEIQNINNFSELRLFLESKKIPKNISLSQGDNQLLINTDNDLELDILIEMTKTSNRIKIKEILYDESNPLVKRGNEKFTNEIIFTFYKNN